MKLNLGAGPIPIPGFTGIDVAGSDIDHDLRRMPWPVADGAAEAVLASHILEHFDKAQGKAFLAECARILAPGGVLALAVPDMDRCIEARMTGRWELLGGYFWTDLNHLMGGDAREGNAYMRHRYMYCWESLAYALHEVGLTPARVAFDGSALGAVHTAEYAAISLYVDARKP
jgi:SAM-dependent methyltransferase